MKLKLSILFIIAGLFFLPKLVHAESISSFNSEIHINQDSSINVTETITYDFGTVYHHGIFRDIPYHYTNSNGSYNLRITIDRVTDENGSPYQYSTSNTGGNVEVKIGDPANMIEGVHTYVISYAVKGAINYFSDHDELYWNATGNGWGVPISSTKAEVFLPAPVEAKSVQLACFAGVFGSANTCSNNISSADAQGKVIETDFTQSALNPGEGMTVVVGFPPGFVSKPSVWQKIIQAIQDNWVLALPLLVLLGMWYLWLKKGRDPLGFSTIVPQYEPPADLSPIEAGTILDETANKQDVSAQIIYLATKGYLKITKINEKIIFFNHTDYQLDKLKDGAGLTTQADRMLMESLFEGKDSVKLSELKYKFYSDWKQIQKDLYDDLTARGYFSQNPQSVRSLYWTIGGVIIGLPLYVFAHLGLLSGFLVLALVLSGIIIIAFSFFMPQHTVKGAQAKQYILGLKMYLSVAEKDRLKFFNAPEKNPQVFEKLLPYAMVLGVEQDWAKQFEGIYTQPPAWYNDPAGGMFNAIFFATSLRSFSTAAHTAIASAPRGGGGAAGGFSGFGGGGFSGGGFGGGGGGSW